MTDKLYCPFCGEELDKQINLDEHYACLNTENCEFSFMVLPKKWWQALIDGKKAQDMLKNSREKLAAFMHDTWSDWFVYQFNNSTVENIQRWQIQSNLPYSSLTEEDKDKDRKFADKIISIITKQGNE
mgnify:CR=1 FL=1